MKKEEKDMLLESCKNILEYLQCRLEYFEKKRKDAKDLDKLILETLNDISKYESMMKKIKERKVSH